MRTSVFLDKYGLAAKSQGIPFVIYIIYYISMHFVGLFHEF